MDLLNTSFEEIQKEKTEKKNVVEQENLLINQNPIQIEENENQQEKKEKVVPGNLILPVQKTEKQILLEKEAESKDYSTLGVGFDLNSVSVNAADSVNMASLKRSLQSYLTVKERILEKMNLRKAEQEEEEKKKEDDPTALIYNDSANSGAYRGEKHFYKAVGNRYGGLGLDDEEALRAEYMNLSLAIRNYTAGKISWFKFGRGKARLKQVIAVKDMLQSDNRKYGLSHIRSRLENSRDATMHKQLFGIWPTWLGAVRNTDMINKRHEKLRRENRDNMLHLGYYGALCKDVGNLAFATYHLAGGTVKRVAELPLLVAANGLEAVGKTAKIGMKGLSMVFNGFSRLFGSKKRWNVKVNKHTMTHGWHNLDSIRRMLMGGFKAILSLGLTATVAPIHSVGRAIANLFRENKKDVSSIWKKSLSFYTLYVPMIARGWKMNLRSFFGMEKDIADCADEDYKAAIRRDDIEDDDDDDDNEDVNE